MNSYERRNQTAKHFIKLIKQALYCHETLHQVMLSIAV